MQEIHDLKRQGVSIQAISQLTGHDRKTIRKYLKEAARPRARHCRGGLWLSTDQTDRLEETTVQNGMESTD